MKLFEVDHCRVGHWLSQSWNLPPDMVEAIASHHEPDLIPGSLASLIAVADNLTAALGYGTVDPKDKIELSLGLIAPLGADDPDAVLKKVKSLPGPIADALAAVSSYR